MVTPVVLAGAISPIVGNILVQGLKGRELSEEEIRNMIIYAFIGLGVGYIIQKITEEEAEMSLPAGY